VAYLALYRAWRPQRFEEVVGQEKTVAALRNAIREGRLSHAYLFSGPRGTGKTSIAKIVARSVNCEQPEGGEPCNQCSSCRDINNGNFMDVIEIDAASNRGIDEIRDLREKVRVLPAQGKKKVYIIDEVHMLTTEAFNALLKTLEEPPDSVIFILATTEAHKIPETIRSRCQAYHFRRLTGEEITSRLQQAAASNSIELDEEALQLIARRANGGMRDALSTLDQVYSYKGQVISKEDVLDVLGLVDEVYLAELVDALLHKDIPGIIASLDLAMSQGKEAQHLVRETAFYLRDLLLYSVMKDQAQLMVVQKAALLHLQRQSGEARREQLLAALKIMMETAEKLRFSEGNRFLLEMSFLELAELFAEEIPVKSAASAAAILSKEKKAAAPSPQPVKSKATAPKGESDPLWERILAGVKEKRVPTYALLAQGSLLGIKGDTMYIGYNKKFSFHKEKMQEKANREILEGVLHDLYQKTMELEFILLDDEQYNDIVVKKAIEFFGAEIVHIKD